MTRIDGPWLRSEATRAVFRAFESVGYRAFFVGGTVRNAVLGEPVSDVDLATDAVPERVMEIGQGAGLKAIPTGIDHGTVTLVSQGTPHEITTFRRDVATDGRRAVVAFTTEIAEDAGRRDFTMNALYADIEGQVIDPLGGLPDAMARHVRFIGSAEDRIREDYLRILRFFRFNAWYANPAGGLDADGLAACAALARGIDGLARERIGAEMRKLLQAPDPGPALASMAQSGVLVRVLPGASVTAIAPLVHLESSVSAQPDAIRRLAALGGEDHARRLRLSRVESRQLDRLRGVAGSTAGSAELGWRVGKDAALDGLLLRAALASMTLPPHAVEEVAHGAAAVFPVRATDLAGRLEGRALGQMLDKLQKRWLASGFSLSRDQLLDGIGAE